MKKLSIITTVYYNEESLALHAEAMQNLRQSMQKELSMDIELIYVNDGSGDNSLTELKKIKTLYPEWVKIVSLSRNFGAMHAVKAGLQFVTGDCFTVLAADLQDPPELLHDLVSAWKNGSFFSICVRKDRDDPFFTTLFSKTFNFLARKFIISTYPKGGYDIFLLDKQYLPYLKNKGIHFNLQLFCYWLGITPKIIYFSRPKRPYGKSRWTFRKKMKLMVDSFVGFSTTLIHFTSLLGLTTSLISFLYGFYIFINALMGHVVVQGYASIICILSFLLGFVIFMLGIICEYLARIYDEVNRKPEYVIEQLL